MWQISVISRRTFTGFAPFRSQGVREGSSNQILRRIPLRCAWEVLGNASTRQAAQQVTQGKGRSICAPTTESFPKNRQLNPQRVLASQVVIWCQSTMHTIVLPKCFLGPLKVSGQSEHLFGKKRRKWRNPSNRYPLEGDLQNVSGAQGQQARGL